MNGTKFSFSFILKRIIILIILGLSIFSGFKIYHFLDFTVGNLLQGMYSSYVLTENGVNKIKDVNNSVKNSVNTLLSKVKDKETQAEIKKEIEKTKKEIESKRKIREEEIKKTRKLINLIPLFLSILISWKMFSFIINIIIDEQSVLNKIREWLKEDNDLKENTK